MFSVTKKIGVLGGGQLGRMLGQAASTLDLNLWFLDKSREYPAGTVCKGFVEGDFNDFDTVYQFGLDKDVITIEIEHVNTDALQALEQLGKAVHPCSSALKLIKDKGAQKVFYQENGIPTAAFQIFADSIALITALESGTLSLPFVQKLRTAGYDGKGVAIIRTKTDLETKLLSGPCITEELVDMAAEIAVIAARRPSGQVVVYPAVEMDFHPEANLVELLICPARITTEVAKRAEKLASLVIASFGLSGLLAVEMFLTRSGDLLVNEVAPRPHNSGHHTIDSAETSQYHQHLRAILDLPLGGTKQLRPAAMINLLGAPGLTGPVHYDGIEKALAIPGVDIHLYGKATTSPFRKMGHITVTAETTALAIEKAQQVKEMIIVGTVQ